MVYDDKFHQRRVGKPYYEHIARASLSTFRYSPLRETQKEYRNVLDIGCSCGALLSCFNLPIKHGLDFGRSSDTFIKEAGTYHEVDLSKEHINLGIGFDLIVCLEVAEHLPSKSSKVFDTFTANAVPHSTLIFSGARRGQRGRHHINCQDSWEWLETLTKIGFKYSAPMTNNFISEVGRELPDCYRSNLLILTKM